VKALEARGFPVEGTAPDASDGDSQAAAGVTGVRVFRRAGYPRGVRSRLLASTRGAK
jgi:hypothetical protein